MNNTLKSGIIISTVLIALLSYYMIWVYVPEGNIILEGGTTVAGATDDVNSGENEDPDSHPTTVNYLSAEPDIPENRIVVTDEIAPDFSYYTIDGGEVTLSDYIDQKYVILDFWATWCGPCLMELPLLQEFYETYGNQVEIIAVSSDQANKANQIAGIVRDKGLTFPVIHDSSGKIGNLYPTRSIPYLIFIDLDGTVKKLHIGASLTIGDDILEEFGITPIGSDTESDDVEAEQEV